jgi:hypothetical protein
VNWLAPALTGTGLVFSTIGVIQWRKYTPRCPGFDLKVQFARTDKRLQLWLGNCSDRLDTVKLALGWDYLLLVGYGMFGSGLILLLSKKSEGLPGWLALLPVLAAAADAAEDAMLLKVLEIRSDTLAFQAGSVLPTFVTIAAAVKFALLAASVAVVGWGVVLGIR